MMTLVSALLTGPDRTIASSSAAKATAAIVPTAYSAVVIPSSPSARSRCRQPCDPACRPRRHGDLPCISPSAALAPATTCRRRRPPARAAPRTCGRPPRSAPPVDDRRQRQRDRLGVTAPGRRAGAGRPARPSWRRTPAGSRPPSGSTSSTPARCTAASTRRDSSARIRAAAAASSPAGAAPAACAACQATPAAAQPGPTCAHASSGG